MLQAIKTLDTFKYDLLNKSEKETGKTRKQIFRCSALPLCPINWIINELVLDGEQPEIDNFGLDWFAGIGTHVHEVLQKWSGYHGQIYGDWEITRTRRQIIKNETWEKKSLKVVKDKLGPVIDKKTGLAMNYRELVVREPNTGLSGHVDCLLPVIGKKNTYIVLDYKTTSLEKIAAMNEEGDEAEPAIGYHNQVQTYWWLLQTFGPWDWDTKKFREPLNIVGSAVFYIARDNPFHKDNGIKVFYTNTLDVKMVKQNLKSYDLAQDALETGKFKKVVENRRCSDRETALCGGCEYSVYGCGHSDKRLHANLKKEYKFNKSLI